MSVEKNNTTGQPEEPDLIELGPENVIPLDIVRMQMRNRLYHSHIREVTKPGLSGLDLLADCNVDVGKAVKFCQIMGIKTGPLEERLSSEADSVTFYSLLYDYLSTIELCLHAGTELGKKAFLIHPNEALANAAMEYTLSLHDEKKTINVVQVLIKMKMWLEQKIEEAV